MLLLARWVRSSILDDAALRLSFLILLFKPHFPGLVNCKVYLDKSRRLARPHTGGSPIKNRGRCTIDTFIRGQRGNKTCLIIPGWNPTSNDLGKRVGSRLIAPITYIFWSIEQNVLTWGLEMGPRLINDAHNSRRLVVVGWAEKSFLETQA